ncbi:MAG: zinc D-Ala-D-Ala dipeptidase [Mycobacterium sp.]|jgi:D-alanyl-D-alanine dipeptidase|uniref:M15 family metallopeptidase n=1 Tax=Mycobacterium sp. TaxID=1785 RepID=UPI0028B4B4D2|nr:M15 family metallopeptidase [Mycobacterium sp.]MDT5120400.1 zinc D-Ala-D-Ala dipeptidase [Mycobacterium sp.]
MRRVRPVISLAVAVGLVAVSEPAAMRASPDVPPVSDAARAAGFVDVRSVVPDAIIDLRYATTNNFTGTQLYPSDARCLVHQSMSQGLATAASALRPQGHLLVFWDCYRPHDVQVRMFNVVPNPAWVARPGSYAHSHESGRSVDVTFTSVQQQCPPERHADGICLADMGTDFDDFSPRATAFATQGVSVDAQANRARLRDAMKYGGLTAYSGEWWHFDGPGAGVDRPILNVPVD